MNTAEQRIKDIVKSVLEEFRITLKEVILFGSRARGDYKEESDFDLLILVENNINTVQKRNIWKGIYQALHRDFPLLPFDIIIKTIEEFEAEKNIVNTISNEAYIEGIKI